MENLVEKKIKQIHQKDSHGLKSWKDYDVNGNAIHYRDSDDKKWWK